MANKGEFKAVPAEENESAVEISAVKAKSADISADAAATTPPPATVASTATDTKAAEDKDKDKNEEKEKEKEKDELKNAKAMSFYELMVVLKPFFWPSAGSDGALLNRIRAASTWGAVMISKACSLAAPLFLLDATNELVAGDWDSAKNNIIGFVGLKLASSFFKEIQGALYVKVKQQALIQLQRYTFGHLHNLSLSWHLNKKAGAVMKSMDRGVEGTNNLVTYMFLFLIPALAECFVVMVLFFTKFKDVWLVGVTIGICVAIYVGVTVRITIWRKKFRQKTNKHDNDFHDKAMDSITNFETVKYFAAEPYEVERYVKSVIKFQGYTAASLVSMQILNFIQQFILQACLVACLLISGKAVTTGEMSIGTWVAIQTWIIQIFQPLNFLGTVYYMIVQALIDVRNLSELLSEKPDIVDLPTAKDVPYYTMRTRNRMRATSDANVESTQEADMSRKRTGSSSSSDGGGNGNDRSGQKRSDSDLETGLSVGDIDMTSGVGLSFNNVSFNYPSQPVEKGLKGVTFTVSPGTTTAVVGHTGAGKTTISRLIFRFYEPTAGNVKLGDYDIREATQISVRSLIGVVPQDTVMFNESILYNIRYGRLDATDEEVKAAAEAAQIRTFVESLPEAWQTVVGERGLKLSGGEKQRVAIARCLLKNPPVVLLDEATSALDTITENSVQEALDALGHNRTVLIIAHRLSTIRHADQILAMDNGRIMERGTHEELVQIKDGYYKKLWDMQSRTEPVTPVLEVDNAEVMMEATSAVVIEAETAKT